MCCYVWGRAQKGDPIFIAVNVLAFESQIIVLSLML